jgi:hypothetical protein
MGLLEPQADNSQYLSVPIGVRIPHRFTVRIVKTLKYREHFWVRFAKISRGAIFHRLISIRIVAANLDSFAVS